MLLNPEKRDITTFDENYPDPIRYKFFDQVSNSSGDGVDEVPMYLGYACIDDAYSGIYVGNAATLEESTRLVRLPQTSWSSTEVRAVMVESFVSAQEAYLYIRNADGTWLRDEGLARADR